MVISLFGGVGLFLLGMTLLTDGLKSFAGDSLRAALLRFTGRPVTAFLSGLCATALVQSSSATTVATIGFVSAGLLSFSQSMGIVLGASLGTTSTGWLVSLFGLKIRIGTLALPMIGVGAFLHLLGRGRWAPLGLAVAGFGLIFIGIDHLQQGMSGLNETVDVSGLPSSGFFGHAWLMLAGLVLTVLMQSSSAAVATTLTALHAGTLNFEQSASVVIGAAIGTTVTAALAAIGATVVAQRTALAHILFNLFTGLVALVLLPVFLAMIAWANTHLGLEPGAVSLAAFHTLFIAFGVALIFPFLEPFGRWIERLRPDHGPALTRSLDRSLLAVPPVAMEALRRCLRECSAKLFQLLVQRLRGETLERNGDQVIDQLGAALGEARDFLGAIPPVHHQEPGMDLRLDSVHALDHLSRLLPSARQDHGPVIRPLLAGHAELAARMLAAGQVFLENPRDTKAADNRDAGFDFAAASRELAEWRKSARAKLLEATASGELSAEESLRDLDAIRWIDQIGYHTWRILHHLGPEAETGSPRKPSGEVGEARDSDTR